MAVKVAPKAPKAGAEGMFAVGNDVRVTRESLGLDAHRAVWSGKCFE